MDIDAALSALEGLAASPSTSASGPLNALLEKHFATARDRLVNGDDPADVIGDLQKNVAKAKKEVEKGLKAWYSGLGSVGKAVDKNFPPALGAVSDAYADPPLFSSHAASKALDKAVLDSLGRAGCWEAVDAFQEETGLEYDPHKRQLGEELFNITNAIEQGDVQPALEWCQTNSTFLSSPPHPSPLPYHLHRSVFLSLDDGPSALKYARANLLPYVTSQPVLQLITSCLYPNSRLSSKLPDTASAPEDLEVEKENGEGDGMDIDIDDEGRGEIITSHRKSPYTHDSAPLITMFRAEFCRLHGLPKEEPLKVAVDLGSRGGALGAIEKARKVMGDRLGNIRKWTDLPMEIPLPESRRYHSVFVCPVSKEQATEDNPPKMLLCGHVIASESLQRMLKGGRRIVKCPYCPMETSVQAAQRLYF